MARVAVMMGSDSDWDVMADAVAALEEMGIDATVEVLSAHRSPDLVIDFVRRCESEGVAAFICGAGLAAHLAGAVAAHTIRPVLGVPLAAGTLGGLDALLSTAQMPPGVPVATFAVGKPGARNAGLCAAQIIALSDPSVEKRLRELKQSMAAKVRKSSEALAARRGRP